MFQFSPLSDEKKYMRTFWEMMFLTYKCSSLGRSVKAPFSITLRLLIFLTDLQKEKEKSRRESALITPLWLHTRSDRSHSSRPGVKG